MIDSSLSMDPLVVELGKRTVIAGEFMGSLFHAQQQLDLLLQKALLRASALAPLMFSM